MTAVLLTGGTGFVGGHLRAALRERPVTLLGREEPELQANEQWVYADLAEPVEPEKLSSGKVLYHLAYSMPDGCRNVAYNRRLLDAVNACPRIERVVLMSTTSVYGANGSPVVDEDSLCNPAGEYAETKLACEMVWRDGLREDCALTVLRSSEVIRPGGKGLRTLIRDALDRPLVGTIKRCALYHRPLHYVAVNNAAAAVLFCLQRRQGSARETFVVSDDHQPENECYAAMQDTVRTVSGQRPLPGAAMPRGGCGGWEGSRAARWTSCGPSPPERSTTRVSRMQSRSAMRWSAWCEAWSGGPRKTEARPYG
jgi:nucleoside-diphosphate-sugar epimerase